MINSSQNRVDILQDRFGLKAASYLSAGAAALPYDVSERLRAARVQAVSKRKAARTEIISSLAGSGKGGELTWGSDDGLNWWSRVGSVFPLVVLVVGLLLISSIQTDKRAQEVAEVDSALLTDVLPPAAFADPGFVQYLKSVR